MEITVNFDFENLNGLLELVGDAGVATSQVGKAVETVKGLFKRTELAADADVKAALAELADQIANAKMANADLKIQLSALKDALREVQSFQAELDRYSLWETPTGSIVYRLKEAAAGDEPMHYLCPTCVEEKRKSILQGGERYRECPVCKTEFRFKRDEPIRRTRSGRGSFP